VPIKKAGEPYECKCYSQCDPDHKLISINPGLILHKNTPMISGLYEYLKTIGCLYSDAAYSFLCSLCASINKSGQTIEDKAEMKLNGQGLTS
jgi:hypothetical protein